MRRSVKRAVAYTVGVGCGGALYLGFNNWADTDHAQQDARIENCAKQLGPVAMNVSELPVGCTSFASYFLHLNPGAKPATDTTVPNPNASYYTVRSQEDFKAQALSDESSAHGTDKLLSIFGSLAVVATAGVVTEAGFTIVDQNRRRQETGSGNVATVTA